MRPLWPAAGSDSHPLGEAADACEITGVEEKAELRKGRAVGTDDRHAVKRTADMPNKALPERQRAGGGGGVGCGPTRRRRWLRGRGAAGCVGPQTDRFVHGAMQSRNQEAEGSSV